MSQFSPTRNRPRRPVAVAIAVLAVAGTAACTSPPETDGPERSDHEIVAGQAARADDIRSMAALFTDDVRADGSTESEQFCGGVFVAPNLVLTGAHCMLSTPAYLVSIGNGTRRLSDHLADGRFVTGANGSGVAAYWLHPRYDDNEVDNDVALVALTRPLPGARALGFIDSERQERKLVAPGTPATALGWGATDKKQTRFPDGLRRGTLPVLDRATCGKRVDDLVGGGFTEAMFCAGGGKSDTCTGDSGGPLLVTGNGDQALVAGVTSYGLGDLCGIKRQPGVYARLATLGSWVRGCIESPSRCTGEVASYCRIDGSCANGSLTLGVADTTSPSSRDRALCFQQARAAFVSCGNTLADGPVSASFGDASGTKVTQFPACLISGQCVKEPDKLQDGLLAVEEQAECLANAQSLHELCGNGKEPITATFLGPDGLASRTFPSSQPPVASGAETATASARIRSRTRGVVP
jgi:secreted trypsin-like serine protease